VAVTAHLVLFPRVAVIPGLRTRSPNVTNREHWSARKKRVDREKGVVTAVLRTALGRPPALPLAVTLTRCGPVRMDTDNAIGSLKATRDAVAAWLGCDDGSPLVTWRYEQAHGPFAVRIALEAGTP
jgi:hypothetical protein